MRKILAVSFITILILSCGVMGSQTTTVEQNKISITGIWIGRYRQFGLVEILSINKDGTYQQSVQDNNGFLYISTISRWHTESKEEGRYFLILENGRYYPSGIEFSNLLGKDPFDGSPYLFYDPKTGASVKMVNNLVLDILSFRLCHFPTDIDDAGVCYSFLDAEY